MQFIAQACRRTLSVGPSLALVHLPAMLRPLCTSVRPPRRMSSIVWMDLEMTGLSPKTDTIMELVCVITNNDLDVLATGPTDLIVHHSQERMERMTEWCRTTHTKTGLWDECLRSTKTVQQCEQELLAFLRQHMGPRECPLAGNTIYMDRMFIAEYMPELNEFLHYRLIDVSTCKELCKRWNPSAFGQTPAKRLLHRGLDDILESIAELKYYRQFMFNKDAEQKATLAQ